MNAEQVVEKIIAEARQQADAIKKEAADKAKALQAKADAELKSFNEETQQLTDKAKQDAKARVLAAARMQAARELLAAKRELLDSAFAAAADKLNKMPADTYLPLIENLLKKAVATGDEEVIIGKDEKRIDEEFVQKFNASTDNLNLTLSSERADFGSGFLLKNGSIVVNVSSEVLLKLARQQTESQIIAELTQ